MANGLLGEAVAANSAFSSSTPIRIHPADPIVISKADTKNIRTRLKAICISKGLDVKNNDDRIPALLDLLDPKENNDDTLEER